MKFRKIQVPHWGSRSYELDQLQYLIEEMDSLALALGRYNEEKRGEEYSKHRDWVALLAKASVEDTISYKSKAKSLTLEEISHLDRKLDSVKEQYPWLFD